MNYKNSSPNRLTTDQWFTSTQRLCLWKDYLFKDIPVSWEMEVWFYWMAFLMEEKLTTVVNHLDGVKTLDDRYIDQLQQMKVYVQDTLSQCRRVLIAERSRCYGNADFPCQTYKDRFRCHCHRVHAASHLMCALRRQDSEFPCQCHEDRFQCFWFKSYCSRWNKVRIGSILICTAAKNALTEDVSEMIQGFLSQWLYESYYVWKLYRQGRIVFPVPVNIYPMSLSDIRLWEVVCEDEEKQILCHPLLPHPRDFIERRIVKSPLYVDKARFQYQIPSTLPFYPVVLSKERSIIPRIMASCPYQEETVVCGMKQPIPQVTYQESSTSHHKTSKRRKKRKLSKILKEGRKKNKTQWIRHRRLQNPFRHSFPVDAGEDYDGVYDDSFYYIFDTDSDFSYDRYDEYDYDYEW